MSFAWKLYVYFYLPFIFLNIFYDYIFQSEQFCYIIIHRVYKLPFGVCSNFILKDFLLMLYFYFLTSKMLGVANPSGWLPQHLL